MYKDCISKFSKINNTKGKENLLIFDRERINPSILNAVFAASLAKKYNFNTYVITNDKYNFSCKILSIFGIKNFYSHFYNNYKIILKSFFIVFLTIKKIKSYGFEWFIKKFKLDDIYYGDLIYDSYIRFDRQYLNSKVNLKFIKLLLIAVIKIKIIQNILLKKKPKIVLTNGGGYATISGISARIANKMGIRIITPYFDKKNNISFIDNKNKNCMVSEHGDIKKITKKQLLKKTKLFNLKKINRFILERSRGRVVTNITNALDLKNKKNKFLSKKELIRKLFNKKKIDKLILICPHAFSDCPNLVGEMIFKDYYDQLYETLHFINSLKFKNIGWIVKPHPGSKRYGEQGIVENLVKKINNDFIKLCIKSLSTENLTKICDNVITCTGTVGLEFAVEGKYSVNAGIPYYANLGFSKDHKNKKDFFQTLKNINNIKKLTNNQILTAKRALFYFENFKKGIPLNKSKFFNEKFIFFVKKNYFNKKKIFKKLNKIAKKNDFLTDKAFVSIQNLI